MKGCFEGLAENSSFLVTIIRMRFYIMIISSLHTSQHATQQNGKEQAAKAQNDNR
jgi:hypothetical protein